MMVTALLFFVGFLLNAAQADIWEEKFEWFGCKGKYNKHKMAHLERICDECFEQYKEQDLRLDCRSHCFGSKTFFNCVESVTLTHFLQKIVMDSWSSLRGIE